MQVVYKLKVLSGALDGVEFTLAPGDTIFSLGSPRALHEGTLQHTAWAQADNVFYIPDETRAGAFRVRCSDDDMPPLLQVRNDTEWQAQPLSLNDITHVLGIAIAVRRDDQAWSADVLEPHLPVPLDAAPANDGPVAPLLPQRRAIKRRAAAALAIALLALGAGWMYERSRPATQVRTLEAALDHSPYHYAVVHDGKGALYAFSDSAEAAAWGQRASARAGRHHDHYRVRSKEAARLGTLLDAEGVDYAIVRLRDPAVPEIVLASSGGDEKDRHARVLRLLSPQVPYARTLDVRSVSDAQLIAIARQDLRARGISTRVSTLGGRSAISNDIFLDDAGLHAMAAYRREFARQWGERRISINIRLWDDLLKGRSFQYSQDQLLSVGQGRWEFSTANAQ